MSKNQLHDLNFIKMTDAISVGAGNFLI